MDDTFLLTVKYFELFYFRHGKAVWSSKLSKYLTLYAKLFLVNFIYLFYDLCDSGVILKELIQNSSFSVKNKVLTRGRTPLISNKNILI